MNRGGPRGRGPAPVHTWSSVNPLSGRWQAFGAPPAQPVPRRPTGSALGTPISQMQTRIPRDCTVVFMACTLAMQRAPFIVKLIRTEHGQPSSNPVSSAVYMQCRPGYHPRQGTIIMSFGITSMPFPQGLLLQHCLACCLRCQNSL
eukprot:365381-Chlamydomonas_euryale.AAC.1